MSAQCLICLESGDFPQWPYHPRCLQKLLGSRGVVPRLPFTRADYFRSARQKSTGFSISGVQTKLQCRVLNRELVRVTSGGTHIIKPSPETFPLAAENEHLTMRLLGYLGVQTAASGLLPFADGELCYVTRRYDRTASTRIQQEDMLQAMGISNLKSESKYEAASYQTVLAFLKAHGSGAIQIETFRRIVCAYLLGNDDYHLKNISVFPGPPLRMTPAYDFLNTELCGVGGPIMALDLLDQGMPHQAAEMGNGRYYGGDFIELAVKAGISHPVAVRQMTELVNRAKSLNEEHLRIIKDRAEDFLAVVRARIRYLEVLG
ncbi:MAG: HipA domain-containing protein [Hahellaceae bacterium]|nr:HipA domain-containing protein [Hahellaceae bacterium]